MSKELDALDRRLAELGIEPRDLVERFVRSGGPGGQHVNKTSTAVQLAHRPTGVEARAEGERSQLQNRIAAREQLIARIEMARTEETARRRSERERERRRRRRPPPGVRRRILETKRKRGNVKRLRGKVSREDS